MDEPHLYSSRLIKNYIEYIKKFYPHLDTNSILHSARIAPYEVEDAGHWFSQTQVDRFHDVIEDMTDDKHISLLVGRYSASSKTSGLFRGYALGLTSPTTVYKMLEKFTSRLSRASIFEVRELEKNKVEVTVKLTPGVQEKPYQCENRIGLLQSVVKVFTNQFGKVEHPNCLHKGDDIGRYIISWEQTPATKWKRISKILFCIDILASVAFIFTLPFPMWLPLILAGLSFSLMGFVYCLILEKRELNNAINAQGEIVNTNLEEINIRYNNALLIKEIGQATSTILNPRNLIETMSGIMEKRLDFDRGAIWLASKDRTRLIFQFGYGYNNDQEILLRKTRFHLDNPQTRGPFVSSFREQKPVLLNDIHKNAEKLSDRSLFLAKELKVQSLVCVPIVYEKESLGVLTVDNLHSKRPLTKTDMSLLIGVASQAAMSLINARSFQNMQDSAKKYRELVENANSIILRVDMDGGIVFFNEFAQRFFGYKENEILGKNIVSTVLPATAAVEQDVRNLINKIKTQPEKRFTTESRTQRKSGETVWIVWTFKPNLDTGGAVQEILCIGNDITELKVTEKKRHELEMRLQRAQKMEAIGTLAGGVAHDLNNILAGLVSYPELLLMQIPEDSKLRKPISTIQKAGEKAASIVQDLLTLARRGVSASEVLNLNQVASDYLMSPEFETLRSHHSEVELQAELERDLLNILGSPVHISKTIMNLVSNAAEAMPDGGKITLSTQNMYLDRPIGGFTQVEEGDYAVLSVSDTGIGIPAEDLDRIFEPFFTKKKMGRSGTGLGMAVVWGTVKDHNGYIDIQSEEGQGTTFNLYFPITRKDLAGDKAKPVWEDYKGRGESILVVDDVLEQREVAKGILEQLGYEVTCLSSGEEAVEFMKSYSFDLLVLDMIMAPGMDGLETYRKILELHPGQKAIIASGFSESGKVKEAQELGAGAYVKKPYLMEKIGIVVREELDR